ncbi:hypothetical protein ANCDUO_23006 [Ancylostoma duodenale]|uniref:Uncharacterized protein n=1 Tax=Ancylostoma duodenale TaxID=51022 RepID=A0A0C2BSU1_9BILA|nr:hypothetical protein ANCDUO_23006 [Ancylostoma duodenale]
MEQVLDTVDYEDYGENFTDCTYIVSPLRLQMKIPRDEPFQGTDHLEVKIYLIGVFATFIAILSIIFNTFFTLVFLTNQSIRKSSVFYFGILAVIDTVMAVNYIAVMSIPVRSCLKSRDHMLCATKAAGNILTPLALFSHHHSNKYNHILLLVD